MGWVPVAIFGESLYSGTKPTHPHLTEVDSLTRDWGHTGTRKPVCPATGTRKPVCQAWVLRHAQVGITEADTSVDNANTSGHTMSAQAATL